MAEPTAKFLTGDLMRHIVVMSASASVGLVSIFLVDFVDLLFISMLGEAELAAAVGFAGTLLFFTFSISIGLTIAASALAAQRLGRGDADEARRITTSVIIIGLAASAVMAALVFIFAPQLVALIGGKGHTADLATRYLRIVVVTMPIGALGMMCSGLLRAHGDARRAMTVTLTAGIVNAVLDPILIFGLGLGLDGAALASVAARIAMAVTAVLPILRHYGGFARPVMSDIIADLQPIMAIAVPAVLTNIATPFGNGFLMRVLAPFGDGAVAGYAVVGRLTPLAFCVIFALSGAVGPIIGQNFGAKDYSRVRGTLFKAIQFTAAYIAIAWLVLFVLNSFISDQFKLGDDGREIVFWFALLVAPLFFFDGALFISNAAFNNLRRPLFSTALNWGRNTLGVVPFIIIGAGMAGAPGVVIGRAVGGVLFAALGLFLAFRLIDRYDKGSSDPDKGLTFPVMRQRPDAPFSSPRG